MAAVATVLTLGGVLNQLMSKIGNLMEKARNQGEVLALSAATQIQLAITSAEGAYARSLDLTVNRITVQQKKMIDDLTTEIGYVENHVIAKMRELVDQGSIIVNTLPFSNNTPQLASASPLYVDPFADLVEIIVKGNFRDIGKEGYQPTLAFGSRTFDPVSSGTLLLKFRVPADAVGHSDNKLSYADAQLTVPYTGKFLLIFPKKRNASFALSFTGLPKFAGQFTFHTEATEMGLRTQSKQGPQHRQESSDDDIPDPIGSGYVWIDAPTPGWLVAPETVSLHVAWAEGDWINMGNRSSPGGAAWSIATKHHGIGTSGKVHFHLAWQESRNEPFLVSADETTEVKWGTSRVFQIKAHGTWKATFVDFLGKSHDIASPTFTNPYIRIETSGDSVSVISVP